MADGEGAQDFFEDIPARESVDKSGRAQQGDADSQQQPQQGQGPRNTITDGVTLKHNQKL